MVASLVVAVVQAIATMNWEPYNMIQQQFPIFHLEDKVQVQEESNDRSLVYQTYQRRHKHSSMHEVRIGN